MQRQDAHGGGFQGPGLGIAAQAVQDAPDSGQRPGVEIGAEGLVQLALGRLQGVGGAEVALQRPVGSARQGLGRQVAVLGRSGKAGDHDVAQRAHEASSRRRRCIRLP